MIGLSIGFGAVLFVVTRERGPAWDASRSMQEQDDWSAHAAFMNGLAGEGFIVVGGPLGGETRILLVIEERSEEGVRARFDADPWTEMLLLRIESVQRWNIQLGSLRKS